MPILNAFTFLGSTKLSFIILLLLAFYFRSSCCIKNICSKYIAHKVSYSWLLPNLKSVAEARVWFLIMSMSVTSALCGLLKCLLGRARPMMWIEHQQFGFYWFKITYDYWSFPSGHTTTIVSLALGLSVLFPRYTRGFLFFALCIVVSRVLLLQHYLSDVLATSLLVFIEMGFLIGFLKSKQWLAVAFDSAVLQPTKKGRTK